MDNRNRILRYVEQQYPIYRQMALAIHAHPEVSKFETVQAGR